MPECVKPSARHHAGPDQLPDRAAGLFRAWVLAGAAMYAVPLRVPRVFYVNSVLPPEAPESPAGALMGGVRVRRTLPFGREPLHLYQARPHVCKGVMCSIRLC